MKKRILVVGILVFTMLYCMGISMAASDHAGETAITSSMTTLTSGDYYLAGDVQLASGLTMTSSGTEVNLDLNGYTLTGTSTQSVITVSNNAVLNIYDDTTDTKTFTSPTGAGDFTVTGGVITGGTSNGLFGGGGLLINGGIVNMYGGNIVGNQTMTGGTTLGGGVYVGPYVVGDVTYSSIKGYFNFYGGSVSGNTSYGHGGGIYVKSNAYCTIDGGTVSYNYNADTYGGGVYVVGTVTMKDGTISYNKTALGGGGLSVVGPFNMSGGTIEQNIASGSGGGIFVGGSGTVTMSGDAQITQNQAAGNSGGVYLNQTSSRLVMTENSSITWNTANSGGGGVTFSQGYWTVSDNATVTDNHVGSDEINGYLMINRTITVADALTGEIGVTYQEIVGVVATGSDEYTVVASDKDKFSSDDDLYVITRVDDTVGNTVELVRALADVGVNKSQEYGTATIDVSTLNMFDFDFADVGFGAFDASDITAQPVYTISAVTGQGEIDGQYLDVTHVGTFTVTVTTALCDTAPPTTQTATLTITPKEVTITGLTGVSRRPVAGDTTVELTGGSISGVINGDNVSIDYDKAYGIIDDNSGYQSFVANDQDSDATFVISVRDVTLVGSNADNYTLVSYNTTGSVVINRAVPYISWPSANDVILGTATDDSQLLGGKVIVYDSGAWTAINGIFHFVTSSDNTKAGTYGQTVQFVPGTNAGVSATALETIENATRTVYQVVEAAEVQFSVDDDGAVAADVLNSDVTISASDYSITDTSYKNNITLVHVAFTDNNFRHAGTMESTGKQIGAYGSETKYSVTFTDYPDNNIVESADPQDIHILPTETGVVGWETTWAGVTTVYDAGSRFPQPEHDVVFAPVMEAADVIISGTVIGTDLDGTTSTTLSAIGVTLMQGSEIIATTTTGSDGTYSFTAPKGMYNVIFTRDQGTRTEVTRYADSTSGATICDVTMDIIGNSALYIAEGMTAITVEGLSTSVGAQSSRMEITSATTAQANEMIASVGTTSDNLKLFYNISFAARDDGDYTTATPTDVTIYIPLAGIYQDKVSYTVYYMVDDDTELVYGISNDTALVSSDATVNAEKDMITLPFTYSGLYGICFESTQPTSFTGNDLNKTYTTGTISIDGMFDFTEHGTNPVYSITAPDGATATIDSSTGEVTVSKVGDYTITVVTEATGEESAHTSTATLTVTPKYVTVENITALSQASIEDDLTQTVTLNDSALVIGVEHGDVVSVNMTGESSAVGTISYTTSGSEDGYWDNQTLTTVGENIFDVAVTGLVLTGADAENYILSVTSYETTVLIYQDLPYFAWPTAKDVTYGDARVDEDLYGGKAMVKNPITGGWTLLEGDFVWVDDVLSADSAGTHAYSVKFVETNSDASATYRSALDDARNNVEQIVQKAEVQFVIDKTTGVVTATDLHNDLTVAPSEYTLTYRLQGTTIDTIDQVPAEDGAYWVYAYFVEAAEDITNYRHAGTLESTGKQIGSFYQNVETETYTVTFMVGGVEDTSLRISDATSGDIHILPTLDENSYLYWETEDASVYDFGSRYAQPTSDVVLTAVVVPTKDATITGTIIGTELDLTTDTGLYKIAVTLMSGSEIVDYTETDINGNYRFTVASGSYNLVIHRDQNGMVNEITEYVKVASGETKTVDVVIPDTEKNTEIYISSGASVSAVDGLNDLVANSEFDITVSLSITSDDDFRVDGSNQDYLDILAKAATNGLTTDNLKLFMNIDLTQNVNQVTADLTEADSLLVFDIPLPGLYQGYDSYSIYRYHNGTVDILTETPNDDLEKVVLSDDGTYLTLYANKFSLYCVAYENDPVDDGNNGGGGGGGSSTTTTETTTATLNRVDHNAYMNGYPDETFGSDKNITRAETTVMFSRLVLEQMEMDTSYANTFNDVGSELWYYDNIGFMEQFGIITGYLDGSFKGDSYITRAEFATIACRFDDLSSDGDCPFVDVDDSHWASSYITAAAEKGWITGYENGTFLPDQYITRAEAVTLVNRMLERYCDQDYVTNNPDEILHFIDLDESHWAYYQIMEAVHTHDYTKTDDAETWEAIYELE